MLISKQGLVMSAGLLALAALSVKWGLSVPAAKAEPARVGLPAAAAVLPDPPRQHEPWMPPRTSLSSALLAASATLFGQGLADPRGCEYRTIEITTGNSTGGGGERARTRGWVLPATGGEQRFAVCWNGLVYPLLTAGGPADLRQDVLAVVEPLERKQKGAPNRVFGTGWAVTEGGAVAADRADRLRACLLLRLGEEELARRMWNAAAEQPVQHDQGPYLDLATDWLWYLFDRTIGAHVRGDDAVALAGARLLVRAQPAVETEAARLGFPRREPVGQAPGKAPLPYIDFGTDPADLLADQEQRTARNASTPAPLVGAAASEPVRRIMALIQALNEISEQQLGQPGGVYLPRSPTIQALAKEGDPAVAPLIDCLETDTRLTRSVHYWRNFARHRQVLPVRSAAYAALTEILKTTRFGAEPDGEPQGWKKLAGQLRVYWKRYQNLPRLERWYAVLQDDAGGPQQWLEAAANITLPADMEGQPGVMSPLSRSFGSGGKGRHLTAGVKGEALRAKTAPSVTELLEKRAAEVAAGVKPDDVQRSSDVVDLALCLSAWDAAAARPTLRREFRRCDLLSRTQREHFPNGFDPENNAWHLAELTLARARGKDPEALRDYTRWLLASQPVFPFDPQCVFEPLWRYPDDPAVAAAAKIVFNAPASLWRREVEKRAVREFGGRAFVNTPLLGGGAFRELVYRLLADRTPAGTASLTAEGQLEINTTGSGMSSSGGSSIHAPLAPKPGVQVPFRRCDLVAWSISQIGGAPQIQLYWPEPNREAAVGQIAQFLRRYAPRLRYSEFQESMDDGSRDAATALTFPVLGRPATPTDLLQTRAIFALTAASAPRCVNLPQRPMRARWTALRKYPVDTQEWDEQTGKSKPVIEYQREGWVWQAEEVQVHGRWERYYGFVGPHEVAKVPASEIEFPTGPYPWNEWGELTPGLDCRVTLAGDVARTNDLLDPPRLTVSPRVEVLLRNRSGLPQRVPVVYVQRETPQVALLAGMELRLWRSPEIPAAAGQRNLEAEAQRKWEQVRPRAHGAFPVSERGKLLQLAESLSAFKVGLDELYDLKEPGLYRVRLVWTGGPGGLANGQSNEVRFILKR